jgi:hypothetical protein
MARKTDDIVKTRGVSLKQTEWEEIERIAADLGITPHAVGQYGLRFFLKAWHEGKIKTATKKTVTLPDL